MTFTPPIEPPPLAYVAPEREQLQAWLDFHRASLLGKLAGLDEEQAGRSLVGSLTTLHGLVRHMAWVEHVWFVNVLSDSDEPNYFDCTADRDADFRLDDSEGLEADVARFLRACERSREVFAGMSLDDIRKNRHGRELDVRWVMIHMIEEYAQHNGHADILRELIDGTRES